MGGSSADLEALLVDGTYPDDPTPGMLPAIFRDIVGRLDAARLTYVVVGRIAMTLHQQARFVGEIEIVADLDTDRREHGAKFVRARQARFAAHMDPHLCRRPITLTLKPCTGATKTQLLREAITRPWFGAPARLASAEHLLWLWLTHRRSRPCQERQRADRGWYGRPPPGAGPAAQDGRRRGERRLRLAIDHAVLSTVSSFSQ